MNEHISLLDSAYIRINKTDIASRNVSVKDFLKLIKKTISFGYYGNISSKDLINFIMILGEYYINKCKLNKSVSVFTHFINYLKERNEIEKQIAMIKDKICIHNKKMDQFISSYVDGIKSISNYDNVFAWIGWNCPLFSLLSTYPPLLYIIIVLLISIVIMFSDFVLSTHVNIIMIHSHYSVGH